MCIRDRVPGGRLVVEFGGAGNVATIRKAMSNALVKRGITADNSNPWYFPTADEYRTRLEANGFSVDLLSLFPRPTPIPGDVVDWLNIFAKPILLTVPATERPKLVQEVQRMVEPELKNSEGIWVVDYVRLRAAATKLD